jgi:putative tryptophan/tyrosine transport system substrate-binding protein
MMDRRAFLAVAPGVLAARRDAQAQQAARVYRIGFVSATSASPNPQFDAFRLGLRESGYVEGKNVIVEARFAEGRLERLPKLVAEVIGLKVDVLLAGSPAGAVAAKEAGHQPENGQVTRPDDPAVAAAARRRGHSVTDRPGRARRCVYALTG